MIALQYFCSDRALFALERSPQAFWISIAILTTAPMALTACLHVFNKLRDLLFGQLIGKRVDFTLGATPKEKAFSREKGWVSKQRPTAGSRSVLIGLHHLYNSSLSIFTLSEVHAAPILSGS